MNKKDKNLKLIDDQVKGIIIGNVLRWKSKKIINKLDRQPDIFIIFSNGLQFEYEKENGDYLEFEIYWNKILMLKIIGNDEVEKRVYEKEMIEEIERF